MDIRFSISVENNTGNKEYVVLSKGMVIGRCWVSDNPSNPIFWMDEDYEPLCDRIGTMGADMSLANKLANTFEFASRLF